MKILKEGRPQAGWAAEYACTGKGNGNGGCGAELLVEAGDVYVTQRHCRDETDYFDTFCCPSCGVETDIKGVPREVSDDAKRVGRKAPSWKGRGMPKEDRDRILALRETRPRPQDPEVMRDRAAALQGRAMAGDPREQRDRLDSCAVAWAPDPPPVTRCNRCNDTGVIDTGNNELPCDCKAGDTAVFNVAGSGQLTGRQIKNSYRSGDPL